ncbi:GmrSD restriction endonuclease domain-containing protein [Brevibacterium marinum]|uniref:GmrSD restriction endonucleases C-terminal domain-containing protein n=1 Tax=Brevibacterium marinum TaxID=418643 RepID=A0A846RWH7_9MICO|nr:hypothetical protein [Brevibacterium marinum]
MSVSMISGVVIRSAGVRVVALVAVLVLALLTGCGSDGAGRSAGSDAAWSTGGGGSADADPVPARPETSPEGAQDSAAPDAAVGLPPTRSERGELKPESAGEGGAAQGGNNALDSESARSMLDELGVEGKAPEVGYDPQLFDWRSDVDDNGCDTRDDVLRRDLSILVVEAGTNGCVVTAGDLDDEYLGRSYSFERESDKVTIDHIVARSNAWQTGAADLSEEELREFANDPLNLLAVSTSISQQKDGGDAAAWLPPNEDYQCEYVARQIAVKHKYGLWVADAEKDAMARVLDTCGDFPAFAEDVDWPEPGQGNNLTTEEATGDTSGESSHRPTEDVPSFSDGDSPREDTSTGSSAADGTTPADGETKADGGAATDGETAADGSTSADDEAKADGSTAGDD